MKELLDRLGSYNIFNYLLPGVVFAAIAGSLTDYSFIQDDVLIGAFVYYFLGMIISRIGSILIEPILKKIRFVKFSSYQDYISASKKDELIPTLSEANNMYRTLASLFLCLLMLKGYEMMASKLAFFKEWEVGILVIFLFVLFLMSYRKQTAYISKRVQHNLSRD
ncbi:MAG: hypothetical protein KDI50_06320 [Candidatus Competibacteraceae bacterium]|nr:hypothetical protein [Candidatus Competibacteraceae bacterium]